ncbi:hypothetical protein EC988_009813, partial [Linderina pennispora]
MTKAMSSIDFEAMREHTTTEPGLDVVNKLERSNAASIKLIELVSGDDNPQRIIANLSKMRRKTVDDRKKLMDKVKKETKKQPSEETKEKASNYGKDLVNVTKGIATSESLRKVLADASKLISDTIRGKESVLGEGAKDAEAPKKEMDQIRKELGKAGTDVGKDAYDAVAPLAQKVRDGEMTAAAAAAMIASSSKEKLSG